MGGLIVLLAGAVALYHSIPLAAGGAGAMMNARATAAENEARARREQRKNESAERVRNAPPPHP